MTQWKEKEKKYEKKQIAILHLNRSTKYTSVLLPLFHNRSRSTFTTLRLIILNLLLQHVTSISTLIFRFGNPVAYILTA